MANISLRLLSFSLIVLGLLGFSLSIVAVSLVPELPQDYDIFLGFILVAACIVNALLSLFSIIIGTIGVYMKKMKKFFGCFAIFFYIIIVPNMGGLLFISFFFYSAWEKKIVVFYFCILIIIYIIQIIISAISLYKIKFTCCSKTEEDYEEPLEMEEKNKTLQ